jgi:hypothetical protein
MNINNPSKLFRSLQLVQIFYFIYKNTVYIHLNPVSELTKKILGPILRQKREQKGSRGFQERQPIHQQQVVHDDSFLFVLLILYGSHSSQYLSSRGWGFGPTGAKRKAVHRFQRSLPKRFHIGLLVAYRAPVRLLLE